MGELSLRRKRLAGRPPFTDDFNAYVEHLRRHFHEASISIGVVNQDQTFLKSFGDAKVSGVEATEDTLYFIASCTKSFTATTLLSVLEDLAGGPDAVSLTTKISSIIPDDFVLEDEYATKHATLEDALSHRLGIGNHSINYGGEGFTLRDLVQSLRHLSMTAELRERYQYLNLGYMTIQHVIETLTGRPIEQSHQEYIWGPLGMDSTFIRLSDAKAAKNVLADGYSWDESAQKLVNVQYASDYPLVGGGGIISSIKDMTSYLAAHIHGTLPLGRDQQQELYRPRCVARDSPDDENRSASLYALGWNVSSYRGTRCVTHDGGISGFSSKLLFFPHHKWGVAILANTNTSDYSAVEPIVLRLMDDFLGVPDEHRQDLVPGLDRGLEQSVQIFLSTRNRLYPSLPEPVLPPTLPLSNYAGAYYNPGYRDIELRVAKPLPDTPVTNATTHILHIDIRRLLNLTIELEHVSGDYFIAWVDAETPNLASRGGKRARFLIGSNGKVEKLGMNMDTSGGDDDERMVVWFAKTD